MYQAIRGASKSVFPELLRQTLPFIKYGAPLSDVPVKVLNATPEIPEEILDMLKDMDEDVFERIPRHARQQVWEWYPDVFRKHVDDLFSRYIHDRAVVMGNEEMFPGKDFPQPNKRRGKCAPLQELVRAIGGSTRLYRFTVDEIRDRFAKTGNMRYCALRADILMAMHDVMNHTVKQTEPCFLFAWSLDAYVKEIIQRSAQENLDFKSIEQYQNPAVDELDKLRHGIFDKKLVSVFASGNDTLSNNRASQSSAGGGLSGKRASMDGRSSGHHRGLHNPNRRRKRVTNLQSILMEAWNKIRKLDKSKTFLVPVIEAFPNLEAAYLAKVEHPMDLTTIQGKIKARQYSSLDGMRSDLRLIVDNSAAFNGPKHQITQLAHTIFMIRAELILEKAEKTFNIVSPTEKELSVEGKDGSSVSAENNAGKTDQSVADGNKDIVRDRLEQRHAIGRQLLDMETKYRLERAISDAAMIVAAGVARNALTNVFWFLLSEECCKQEALPRQAILVRNTAWLLQNASFAHELVLQAESRSPVSMPNLSPRLERQVMPAMAQMLLDSNSFRAMHGSFATDANFAVAPLHQFLETWFQEDGFVRHTILQFLCGHVLRRDVLAIAPLISLIEKIGADRVAQDSVFMHSLTTCLFLAALKDKPALANDRGPQRSRARSGGGWALPRLSSELLCKLIKLLYLPTVLRVSPLDTPPKETSDAHKHFSRLMALDFTRSVLPTTELLQYTRAAIYSLSGSPVESEISYLANANELKGKIISRFNEKSFEWPRRQYEKLFARYPNFRAACGLPPSQAEISPSPSPFFTPGDVPSVQQTLQSSS